MKKFMAVVSLGLVFLFSVSASAGTFGNQELRGGVLVKPYQGTYHTIFLKVFPNGKYCSSEKKAKSRIAWADMKPKKCANCGAKKAPKVIRGPRGKAGRDGKSIRGPRGKAGRDGKVFYVQPDFFQQRALGAGNGSFIRNSNLDRVVAENVATKGMVGQIGASMVTGYATGYAARQNAKRKPMQVTQIGGGAISSSYSNAQQDQSMAQSQEIIGSANSDNTNNIGIIVQ